MFAIVSLFSLLNNYGISSNMNGDVYGISNLNFSATSKFPTIYSEISSNYEYFDVYSPPISTRYADVYWTMMNPVELPDYITSRFNDKVMAIVGYEQDQVFKIGRAHV